MGEGVSSNAIRIGGWAAVASIVAYVVVLVVTGGDFEDLSLTANAILIAASIATMLVFYGFYRLFQGGTSMPALMLGLGIVGVGLTMIPADSGVTYNSGSVLWGVALIVVGVLMQRAEMSRWLAWLSYLVGALFAGVGIAGLAGAQSASDAINMASIVPSFAWTGWVAWVLIRHREAPAN